MERESMEAGSTTLTLKLIDADLFRDYFAPDSPGIYIAQEAQAAGELGTPFDPLYALEVICLANKLYMRILKQRFIRELARFGAATVEKYLALDEPEASHFVTELVGVDSLKIMFREAMAETRAEVKVGENDPPNLDIPAGAADADTDNLE